MADQRVTVEGSRIRRPAGWWTPTVHALLTYLREVGFTQVPRPLAIVDGEEILEHIPGDSGPAGWARVVPEAGLRAVARLLRPVGLVDFDMAQPGDPIDDVAYALEYVTPFRDDAQAIRWQGFSTPPNRFRRIEVFADEYGLPTVDGLVEAVTRRQRSTIGTVQLLAERGLQRQRQWIAEGFLDELAARVRWTEQNKALFEPPSFSS
jgi:hypothetical protein